MTGFLKAAQVDGGGHSWTGGTAGRGGAQLGTGSALALAPPAQARSA